MKLEDMGKHGGTVLRGFPAGPGKRYEAGQELSSEEVAAWPVANRHALESAGYIQWHAGSPAPGPVANKGAARQRV
jgi:hypothetical protein